MKQSLYNSFIPLPSGAILGYNAMQRRFAVFFNNTFTPFNDIESIIHTHTNEYIQLKNGGFLIEDEIDEKDILLNEISEIDFNPTIAELHINPTLDCNFRCWYCYEGHINGSEMSTEIIESVKKYIDKRLDENLTHFHLGFFGGEPLLKFDNVCRPIIKHTYELCQQRGISLNLSFTTNSYLLTPRNIKFLSKYQCGMQITLDGHREYHDKVRHTFDNKKTYDRIISNITMLVNSGIKVILRINYTLNNIKSVGDIITDLSKQPLTTPNLIHVDFQRVWQDKNNGENDKIKSLIDEYKLMLQRIGVRYSIPELANPRRSSCYGDKVNYVCINYNGDIFKCTARDFKREKRLGYLDLNGELIWDTGRYEVWNTAKFANKICQECHIAPICLGGCRQRQIETITQGQCPLGYDEEYKNELILQRFEQQYLKV